ncbi:alpha/beta fold hydrolase [Actinomyces howellii]|uniref:Lipase 1 n=1 Tax=Actinomyces howellii TaxID=52771 RepID=A0A448HGU5_9ACTO|nr:alpha/beta hydrolase [Actinomyces howellii]VEG27957.1 Lipase 1 precursor [Actinomyces howellii]
MALPHRLSSTQVRVAGVIAAGAVGTSIWHALRLPTALRDARARLSGYGAVTAELSHGEMTYVDRGSGEVILSAHGLYGGYDQAFDNVATLAGSHRVIAPSRLGYPGSAVRGGGSPEDQALAYVELLDHLGIDRVFVLGASAGGTPAIRMALDHPGRVKGLILYCSAAPWPKRPERPPGRQGPPAAVNRDWAMWMLSPLFPLALGLPRSTIHSMLPLSERSRGADLDARVTNRDMAVRFEDYPIESLEPPVLLIHARDDRVSRFGPPGGHVEQSLPRYPRLTTLILDDGGHLLTGHSQQIDAVVTRFISEHAG